MRNLLGQFVSSVLASMLGFLLVILLLGLMTGAPILRFSKPAVDGTNVAPKPVVETRVNPTASPSATVAPVKTRVPVISPTTAGK